MQTEPSSQIIRTARRRIIFLWTYLEWGGAQIYFIAIIKEAIRDWDVTVIMPRASSPEIVRFIRDAGAEVEFIDCTLDLQTAPTLRRKFQRINARILAERTALKALKKYDLQHSILHVETAPWQSWQFLAALAKRGANTFLTLHNALPPAPAWRVRLWKARLRFAAKLRGFNIFTSNKDAKGKLRGWLPEDFRQTIRVTYTCVNPVEIDEARKADYDRDLVRTKHGIAPDDFVVLCVGQFIDRKGRWTFLEAARKGAEIDSSLRFVWVTPKLPDRKDRAEIDSYGLGNRFVMVLSETISPEHKEILQFYRIADVFALASFVEGLPIALLEAMAMGVPSISTNVYAIPEAVKHRETGLLIEAGDANALADAIIDLKNDEELRLRLSAVGRRYVMEHFDERVASRIAIEEYKKCFADNG